MTAVISYGIRYESDQCGTCTADLAPVSESGSKQANFHNTQRLRNSVLISGASAAGGYFELPFPFLTLLYLFTCAAGPVAFLSPDDCCSRRHAAICTGGACRHSRRSKFDRLDGPDFHGTTPLVWARGRQAKPSSSGTPAQRAVMARVCRLPVGAVSPGGNKP